MDMLFDSDQEEDAANSNAGKILTSTKWNQSGTIYVNVDGEQTALSGYTYNKFCPIYSGESRSITGCSNTADAQILYYWIEKGYDLSLAVTTDNYFKIKSDSTTYYVSDTAHAGEGTLTEINNILGARKRIGNGDFIAALNFFCGVNNHSVYGSSTSTSWSYSVSATGKCAASFVAAGFDSYYFIARKASGSVPGLFFTGEDGLTELCLSIMRENIDYGEPIRIGIPGHAVYMDGYRVNSETGNYEYHLNYGWGKNSTSTKWYTVSELEAESITYITIDLSPEIKVRVTDARGDYWGGSFKRGMERINHIVNDRSTTFTFDPGLAGETILLDGSAKITSKVDVAFENICVSLATAADELFTSARGMSFDVDGGSLIVDSDSSPYAIRETGNSAVSVTVKNGFIYSGGAADGISAVQSALAPDGDYSFGEFGSDFRASVTGCAVSSGSAADTVTLGRGAAIFGSLDLGAGDNTLNIGAGSLFYGGFSGAADTLTVNMTIDVADCSGAAAAFADADSAEAFHLATGGVLNLTFDAMKTEARSYDLLCGVSGSLARQFAVNLSVMGETVTLDDKNREYIYFNLSTGNGKLVLNYSPTPPEVLAIVPDIPDATNQDVTLTATFSEDATVAEYSTDGKKWKSYTASGVVMKNNGTVSFRARNSLGLGSEVKTFTVDWIDKTPPDAPTSSADITENTKNKVTVSTEFSADSIVRQYSRDNENWYDYTEPIVFSVNGAAYFRSFDAVGNCSKVTAHTVANIVPSLNVDSTLEGTLGYGANFQDNYDVRVETPGAYVVAGNFGKLNGSVSIMQGKTTVASGTIKNGVLSFNKGSGALLDSALEYTVAVKNSDKGKSASAYDLKLVTQMLFDRGDNSDDWTDLKTAGTAGAVGDVGVLSAVGTVADGWAGFGDEYDYLAFTLNDAARLSFAVTATDAAKFTVNKLESKTDKKGVTTYSLKAYVPTTLSKPKGAVTYSAATKELLLDAGTYYLGVQSTNAKKGGNADYTVSITSGSVFFTAADNSDDWGDLKTAGAAGAVGSVGTLTAGFATTGWVGFGDEYDYSAFTIDSGARLVWNFSASDATKFTINKLESKTDKKGVTTYSLKSYVPTSVKAGASVTAKELLLEKGTYYIGVQSTNAGKSGANAKGGNSDYTVSITSGSVFFTAADNSDDWTDLKTAGAASALVGSAGTLTEGFTTTGWVGFGDEYDYSAFTIDSGARLVWNFSASDATKFTINKLESKTDKKGVTTYSLKSYVPTSVKAGASVTAKELLLEKGTYYIGVQSTNAGKSGANAKGGNSDYTVSITSGSVFFTAADNSDDWTDLKTAGAASALVGSAGTLTAGFATTGWVGFGDEYDYMEFTLADAAKLVWDFSASDATKFTINRLESKTDKKGVTTYSLKEYVPTSVKAGASATTKELLLEKGTYYIGVKSTNAGKSGANAKGGNSDYTVALNAASEFYTNGNDADDAWTAAPALAAGEEWNDWTGFGDAVDWRTLATDAAGGFYDFGLSGVENSVKLTIYRVESKTDKKGVTTKFLAKVKDITATAKKPELSTGGLCLAAGTQYVVSVEATEAKKAKNSAYSVTMTEQAVFTHRGNESWETATAAAGDFDGVLTTAAGGDRFDCFDVSAISTLAVDAAAGKIKVSFCGENQKGVKVAELVMADGSVKKNLSDLTLEAGHKTTDHFTLADLGDAVKYLKVEAATGNLNTYHLSLLA